MSRSVIFDMLHLLKKEKRGLSRYHRHRLLLAETGTPPTLLGPKTRVASHGRPPLWTSDSDHATKRGFSCQGVWRASSAVLFDPRIADFTSGCIDLLPLPPPQGTLDRSLRVVPFWNHRVPGVGWYV